MTKSRDIVVFVAVCAFFSLSLMLIRQLVGFRSPWFGLIVMLDCLGLAAFARPLVTLRIPGFMLAPWQWEREGSIPNALRVPEFGGLLRRTALRRLNPVVYLESNLNPHVVQSQIESAEVAHLVAAVVLVPWIAFASINRQWIAVATLLLVEIFGNVYPILHLRWARVRMGRLQHRAERRRR